MSDSNGTTTGLMRLADRAVEHPCTPIASPATTTTHIRLSEDRTFARLVGRSPSERYYDGSPDCQKEQDALPEIYSAGARSPD
jgi:hypothetical protein